MFSNHNHFNEHRFRVQVDSALHRVRQLLESNRNPVYASEVHHAYDDKYTITEMMVMLALASFTQTLGVIGFSAEQLRTAVNWSTKRSVSLRLKAEEKCVFLREVTKEVDSAQRTETKARLGGLEAAWTSKVVTTVTEYVWKFEATYEVLAFCGVGCEATDQVIVNRRSCTHEIITGTKFNPRIEAKSYPNIDVDISWILRHVKAEDLGITFKVTRNDDKCRTPRRNPDVENALRSFRALVFWCASVSQYFSSHLFSAWGDHSLNVAGISTEGVFVPVLPLLENVDSQNEKAHELRELLENENDSTGNHDQPIISAAGESAQIAVGEETSLVTLKSSDVNAFLIEQLRSLKERVEALTGTFPSADTGKVISAAEVQIMVCLRHIQDLSQYLSDGVDCIEDMLRKQLISAIGRELTSADFSAYAKYHNRKLFRGEFEPRPFCYSVRRSVQHSPEGHISIEEQQVDGSMSEPVYTMVSQSAASTPMEFSLNAATTVRFGGERCLHAWLRHSFSNAPSASAFLSAQARQFSSFVVLVGRIASAKTFEPKYGAIVQNKDDLRIPLLLEAIPSPKEFRDAIESLSPEQQAFARAIRGMQLESTLFGVLVVQIKPQLERLLRLPPESLTKEIRLTQDLTELFLKYQIPADLLTAGPILGDETGATAPAADKINEVKGHVKAMQELIAASKQKELKESTESALNAAMNRVIEESRSEGCMFGEAAMAYQPPPVFGGGQRARGKAMTVCDAIGAYGGGGGFAGAAVAASPMPFAAPIQAFSAPPPCQPPPYQQVQCSKLSEAVLPPVATRGAAEPLGKAAKQLDPGEAGDVVESGDGAAVDYTRLPGQLDRRCGSAHPWRPRVCFRFGPDLDRVAA
jgi:hypothetical protein